MQIDFIVSTASIQFGFRKVTKKDQQIKREAKRLERRQRIAEMRAEKLKRRLAKTGSSLEEVNQAVNELLKRANKLSTKEVSILRGDWQTILSLENPAKLTQTQRDQIARKLFGKREYAQYLQDPSQLRLSASLGSFLRQLSRVKAVADGDLLNKLLCQKLAKGCDVSLIFERMFTGKYSLDLRPQAWKKSFLHLKQFARDTFKFRSQPAITCEQTMALMPLNTIPASDLHKGPGKLGIEITFSDPAATKTYYVPITLKALEKWLKQNKKAKTSYDSIQTSIATTKTGQSQVYTGQISTQSILNLLKRSGQLAQNYQYNTNPSHYSLIRASIRIQHTEPKAKDYSLKPGFVGLVVPNWLKQLTGYQEVRDEWGTITSITMPQPPESRPSGEREMIEGLLLIQSRLNTEAIKRAQV